MEPVFPRDLLLRQWCGNLNNEVLKLIFHSCDIICNSLIIIVWKFKL